jgi:hypothetical protein
VTAIPEVPPFSFAVPLSDSVAIVTTDPEDDVIVPPLDWIVPPPEYDDVIVRVLAPISMIPPFAKLAALKAPAGWTVPFAPTVKAASVQPACGLVVIALPGLKTAVSVVPISPGYVLVPAPPVMLQLAGFVHK